MPEESNEELGSKKRMVPVLDCCGSMAASRLNDTPKRHDATHLASSAFGLPLPIKIETLVSASTWTEWYNPECNPGSRKSSSHWR